MNQKTIAIVLVLLGVLFIGTFAYFAVQKTDPEPLTSASNQNNKSIDLANKYTIAIPNNWAATEVSATITSAPLYSITPPNGPGRAFVSINPYVSSDVLIPGKCVVSAKYDVGILSAPIFCEGQELVDSFIIPGDLRVKYGVRCETVMPGGLYACNYVFVVPDKSRDAIISFFVSIYPADKSSTKTFQGISEMFADTIIPSLTGK